MRAVRYSGRLIVIALLGISADSSSVLSATKALTIDTAQSNGAIDIRLGIDGQPLRWTHAYGLVDMTTRMHDLGLEYCRTADDEHSHPTTFEGIFPDWRPGWWTGSDAPFEDPANYNFDNANHTTPVTGTYTYAYFHSTDGKIDNILDNGFLPLFKFGRRLDTFNWWHRFATLGYTYFPNPIPNTDDARRKVAIVAENILCHYNEGWHNGRTDGIEFWEVWNEPDIPDMWAGDALHFRKLYAAIAQRIRGARSNPIRPEVKVGGCALAWTVPPTDYHRSLSQSYCEDLISYCNANNVPLDFYSWHHYGGLQAQTSFSEVTIWFGGNAWVYLNAAKRIRQALDANGYPGALSICDEWNSLVNQDNPYHDTNLAGAFTACALMYMDYADVYMAAYFPLVNSWGLWGDDINYTREAYALKAFNLLRMHTPTRLAITSGLVMDVQAATADNFAVMAGRSDDGALIQVLLADENQKYILAPGQTNWLRSSGGYWASNAIPDPSRPHYDAVSVTLKHLVPEGGYQVTLRTIDNHGVWVETDLGIRFASAAGDMVLQRAWEPPAVCLITLQHFDPGPPSAVSADWMRMQ